MTPSIGINNLMIRVRQILSCVIKFVDHSLDVTRKNKITRVWKKIALIHAGLGDWLACKSKSSSMVMLANLEHPSTGEEKLKQRYTVSNLEEMKILIWSNF